MVANPPYMGSKFHIALRRSGLPSSRMGMYFRTVRGETRTPSLTSSSWAILRPFHRTAEDGELLPKSDIVESQLVTSLEGGDESANKRRNQAGMVPADRRLIKFGAPG